MLDRPRITINPAPGFRPTFGPSRAREPGNGPGPQNSAGCTKNQLRRPIIRPIRGHFVFLGPTAKRFKKINDKFEATRGLPRVGQGGWLHCGLEAFVCSSSSSWPCRRVCWTDQGSRSIRPRVCGRLSAPRGPGSPGTAPAHKIAQVAPTISPGSKTKQNNHRHSPIQPSRVSGEHLCSNRSHFGPTKPGHRAEQPFAELLLCHHLMLWCSLLMIIPPSQHKGSGKDRPILFRLNMVGIIAICAGGGGVTPTKVWDFRIHTNASPAGVQGPKHQRKINPQTPAGLVLACILGARRRLPYAPAACRRIRGRLLFENRRSSSADAAGASASARTAADAAGGFRL